MGCSWHKVTVADLGEVVGGATPSTKNQAYWDGEIAWLSPKDLTGHGSRYISHGARNITQAGFDSCSTRMLPRGTVLFSSRAPIGYVAIAGVDLCTNQGFKSVVPNDHTDSLFLYYLLKHNADAIERQGSGTTFKEVSGKTMRRVEVLVPNSLDVQKKIGAVLGSIDSKIELNNRLNDYLATACEALVEIMNVDGTTTLADISSQVNVKTACGAATIDSYVSTESLLPDKGGRQTASALPTAGKVTVYQPEDTLVSNIRPYFKKVWYADRVGTCSSDVIVFRAKEPELAPYLYSVLRSDSYFDHVMAGAKGTKMPRGDKRQMMQYPVASDCNEEELKILTSMVNQISASNRENDRLSELRDALLPKLMSGETDVSKIELPTQPNNHLGDY